MEYCSKCGSRSLTQTYRDGLSGYYIKGFNREMREVVLLNDNLHPFVNSGDEHLEYYCNNCSYGWIEKITVERI